MSLIPTNPADEEHGGSRAKPYDPAQRELEKRVRAFNESFLRCPIKGCYERDTVRYIDYDVLGDHIEYEHIARSNQRAAVEARKDELERIGKEYFGVLSFSGAHLNTYVMLRKAALQAMRNEQEERSGDAPQP